MARILIGSYMIRYPLGGMLSWGLQYLLGLHRLGHEVYLVERASSHEECFDPSISAMTDDADFGMHAVDTLLSRYGLEGRWAFLDVDGNCYGQPLSRLKELFKSADIFVDGGTHGSWLQWVPDTTIKILIDGEPGFTQIKWANQQAEGEVLPQYDAYFTNGLLLGSESCSVPKLNLRWLPLCNPVIPDLFECPPARSDNPYTTILNWRSHDIVMHEGVSYGQKDLEFNKFLTLPQASERMFELAVAGPFPRQRINSFGWRTTNAHSVTASFDAYRSYIERSRGEMSVCKNVFVSTRCGWFSDRSAAYLAAGRPVVLQDTGFSEVIPTGRGVFAVSDVDQARDAIEEIEADFEGHAETAREIAREHLSADRVLPSVIAMADSLSRN